MLNELSNDPIQTAIYRLEKQHEEDKQGNSFKLMFKMDQSNQRDERRVHAADMSMYNNIIYHFVCSGIGETEARVREAVPAASKYSVAFHSVPTVLVRPSQAR